MDYSVIKQNLYKAGRMVDKGEVREADKLIRSMVGKGMTKADITFCLTDTQRATLRKVCG